MHDLESRQMSGSRERVVEGELEEGEHLNPCMGLITDVSTDDTSEGLNDSL